MLRYGSMPFSKQCFPDLFDFVPEPFGYGLAVYRKAAVLFLRTDMCESKEVECLRLPFLILLAVADGKPPEFNKLSLTLVHFQVELFQTLLQFGLELLRIRSVLKAHDEVV